jgi:uncharacterized protein
MPPRPPAAPLRAFELHSPETGTDYVIYAVAPDPASEPGPWPAIAFMDGDDQFRFAVAAYESLRSKGEVRSLLLVGVGYGASYTRPANRRIRDYTPTAVATEAGSGGATPFVEFLANTLWPALAERWPVDPSLQGIAGHSLGSLLALVALFRPAPPFNRVLASAPSIWWDERAVLTQVAELGKTDAVLPARLFLGVGENDTPSMTGDLTLLENQLANRPFPQLKVVRRRFADRDHYNVLPESFAEGLRTLFA